MTPRKPHNFRWQIKVSVQANGDPRDGYLYGWVNGVKRWEHNNINTLSQGEYMEINLNSTFNSDINGSNQKRYWDLFSIGPGTGGGDSVSPQAPGNLRFQ